MQDLSFRPAAGPWELAVDSGTRRVYVAAALIVAGAFVVVAADQHLSTLDEFVMFVQLSLVVASAALVWLRLDRPVTSIGLCLMCGALMVLANAQVFPAGLLHHVPLTPILDMTVFTVFAVLTVGDARAAFGTSLSLVGCCFTALLLRGLGWQTAVLSVAAPMCAAFSVRIGLMQLRRSAIFCDLERRDRAVAKRAEAELAVLARQTTWVSRFVHDEVLHSLRGLALGPRISPSEALALATSALRRLDAGVEQPSQDASRLLSDALAMCAQDSGLEVVTALDNIALPVPVAEAIAAATREALRNVRLHSGVDQAELTARRKGSLVTVQVRDDGTGFDTRVVPAGHRGIADSMRARMAEVGGAALIDSRPGETVVRLTWREPRPSQRGRDSRLDDIVSRTRRATVVAALPFVLLNLGQAAIMAPRMSRPGPALVATTLAALSFFVFTPLVWHGRHLRAASCALGIAASLAAVVGAVSVTPTTSNPMAYWLAGGVVPLVVVGVILRPARESVVFTTLVCVIPLARVISQGGGIERLMMLSPALFGPEYVLGAAYSLRWFVGRSIGHARQEADRAAQGELHAYELRERERLLVERVANLRDDVAPFFDAVVSGRLLLGSVEVRTRAALLEAVVRDSINPASAPLDPLVSKLTTDLRAAGVLVNVHANGTPRASVADRLRQVLATVPRQDAGPSVNVQLHADGGARVTLSSYDPQVWSEWERICPSEVLCTDHSSFQTVLIVSAAPSASPTFGTRPRGSDGHSQDHGDAELLGIG